MNTAMSKEELEKILDQAVQDVTERTAGVRLHQGTQSPENLPLTEGSVPVLLFVRIPDYCTVWQAIPFMRNLSVPRIWRNSAKSISMYFAEG